MTNFHTDPAVIEEKERVALTQFKVKIRDVLPTLREYQRHDISLLRWLRARELNIAQSEDLLRKSIEWRAKNDIDNRLNWNAPECFKKNFPYLISGFNKSGNLIVCIPFGRWDVRNAVSTGLKSDIINYVDQVFEVVMTIMEAKSTKDSITTQFAIIFDFEGFTLRQITSKETIECILEFIRRFEGNYPEILYTARVVNAPKIFEILFALIKPLLTPRTVAKVRIFGSNSDKWRQAVLENSEPDQLPSSYGGSNTSCKNYKAADGIDIFRVHEVFPEKEFIPVTIDPGMKHVLKYSLSKNSKLCWNFRTIDFDIGFALLYRDPNADSPETMRAEEVIFECARADSHRHLQTGEFVADKPGTYSLIFDNSFSRFRKKSLSYFVRADAGVSIITKS